MTAIGSDAVRVYRQSPQPRARLVCMPHAGGNASFFRDWSRALPVDIDLLAAQYPGREERFCEPFAQSLESLAEEIAAALVLLSDAPLVLFGHSLGAALAYEVALRLQGFDRPPARLVVSAHPAPHRQRKSSLHKQGDEALLADIRRLSGGSTPLDDPALREVFMPMVRSDYRLIENYRREYPKELQPRLLGAPVDLCFPLDDDEISESEARAWQDITPLELGVLPFHGGHFYLQKLYPELLERLLQRLDSTKELGEKKHVGA